jgi:predicted metal-dependent hydrolase
MTPPRYLPDVPLPPYAFVPGRSPHPSCDPAGHSYHAARESPAAVDAGNWRASRAYLHGIDLFNHGFYWEAHEAWEGLWHACGRRGAAADFLKGLIQLAAAGVKHREGVPQGVTNHARRAVELFRATDQALGMEGDSSLGLRIPDLIKLAETADRDGWRDGLLILRDGLTDESV